MMDNNVPSLRFKEFSGAWEKKNIEDFADITTGNKDTQNKVDDGLYPFFVRSQTIERINSYSFDGEAILTAGDGVGVGKVFHYINGKFDFHQRVYAIYNFRGVKGEYLYQYFSEKFYQRVIKLSAKNSVDSVRKDFIAKMPISIPIIAEQEKIANYLSALDEKINLLSEKEKNLAQYKKAMMQKLFAQEIRFKDDEGKAFEDWEEKTLKEVSSFRRGSFPQPYGLEKWYDDENGFPFVQVYDVDDNFKLKPDTKRKISALAAEQSVFVPKNTLLVTIQGSIGRIAITTIDCYVDRTLLIITSIAPMLSLEFYKYSLFLLFEIEKRKAPGGTIKTITKEALSDFIISIPCLAEQEKIANFLSAIDEKINAVQKQKEAMQAFKKAMLQQMFV